VAAPLVTGPWTNVVSTTNSYVMPVKLSPSEFFRLLYPQ
jgi:hypothetical protein